MSEPLGPYKARPPVMTVQVEEVMDIMIVRDTARHVTSLLGFRPVERAQMAGAAAALAELVLKTGDMHTIHMTGIAQHNRVGVQVSTEAAWLRGQPIKNVIAGLRSKLGSLIDEVIVAEEYGPSIIIVLWLPDER